jgi:Zn-dependent M28 family amino/carboxypeptidase
VFAAANAGRQLSFDLPWTFKYRGVTNWKDTQSPNVVAKLPGSDPTLREEYVVYTAHLDHLGIGKPVNGDGIYNGALDNGSGSADLLEVARAFSRMNPRPRRSILFVSVTGEEAGLLGSDYFAHYPTVKKSSIVANVNMDEDLMLWPLKDVIVYGADHSSLGREVNEAAARLHLTVSPDTQPEQVFFIRSDQYSFVKQGIPAVFPVPGFKSDDAKINPAKIFAKWEQTRYHQPSDDMNQPGLDFAEAARFARFNLLVGYLVAQKTERPTWKKGDFFGEHYGKK